MAGQWPGCGVDCVSYASVGIYSEYFESTDPTHRANLYASFGMLEDAPNILTKIASLMFYYLKRRRGMTE